MCYDVSSLTKRADRYAERKGQAELWQEAMQLHAPIFHSNGWFEPELPVFTNEQPDQIHFHHWPFIPFVYAPKINGQAMNTLNARGDKALNSKTYKNSAHERRCLVMLDGFFEHHTLKDNIKIPHYVQMPSREPFMVGGLWQTFYSKRDDIYIDTVSLVTTEPNKEMAWLHNKPSASEKPRMPFIVPPEYDELWLHGAPEEAFELVKPLPDGALEIHPCKPIRSNKRLKRDYIGNVPEIQQRHHYPELESPQGSLF